MQKPIRKYVKLRKLKKYKSDHLIATILMLEKIKKSNLAKIRKERIDKPSKEKENTSYRENY